MVLSVVAVLGFVWSGAAWAQDEVDAACIDNGDGTWSQERQSVEDYIVEGPLTWVYAGQARHQWEPTSVGEYTFTPVDEPPASLPDRLKKLTWHRPGGEIWRVADVDDSWIDPEMLATAEAETEAWVASDVEMVPETWSPENWVN